jgi:hypothetical protein
MDNTTRTARFSAEQRRELAGKAVLARWAKAKKKKPTNDCRFDPNAAQRSVIPFTQHTVFPR